MAKFNFDDVVFAKAGVPASKLHAKAWVVGITTAGERTGEYYKEFGLGTIYTIEFEDGTSTDVVESDLSPWREGSD
jgi:hypothetical protein